MLIALLSTMNAFHNMEDETMQGATVRVSAIHSNSKTGQSIDLTTDCPKRRNGKACKYCYVEQSRTIGYNAKIITEHCPYQGEIKRFSAAKVAFLNRCGGIRMFSFGDYMPEFKAEIVQILADCLAVGLEVKAITKVPEFVTEFHDHPAIRRINVSIDNVGDGVDWKIAKSLRKSFSKVRIRCAVMVPEDVQAMEFVDVFTFNHASGLAKLGYRKFSKSQVIDYAGKLDGRVCCTTGKCETCPLKC